MVTHPRNIGKYEVVDVLGQGGMGIVYKATDPRIGRFVAIKMITSGFSGNPDLLRRFYREAQSTGTLQNPNIVTVYDMGDHDGNPYLVMEYLEGVTLESIIASHRAINLVDKLGIIVDVCNGLSYAHQRAVIHRDIKPANIMVLNDGTTKIVDFGIAQMGDSRFTRTQQLIGSIHYMSPEQLKSQSLDWRTDIFSTGVVLYQLLTYALPFDASDTAAILLKIVNEPPPPLHNYLNQYPAELEPIVVRALTKDPEKRYEFTKDLAFDLMQVQELLRREGISDHLRQAERSIERMDWNKAKEQLQQVLTVDRQHVQAHRLLSEVQANIRKQQKSEQARSLRANADEACLERRYEDALRLVDQALNLDEGDADLLSFRNAVRTAKTRAEKLVRALRQAEAANNEGDLDRAMEAVEQALALDPDDTQARALQHVVSAQREERARQEQMHVLLEQARAELCARNLPLVFDLLNKAKLLDPVSPELQSFTKLANSVQEQELRRAELASLTDAIQAALMRGDYVAAVAKAEDGLKRYPRELDFHKLKVIADAQRQRTELTNFIREQLSVANRLLETGEIVRALDVLDKALQRAPGEPQLQSLQASVEEKLQHQRSQQLEARNLQRARDAVAANNFQEAIRLLENLSPQGLSAGEIDELLSRARAGEAKQKAASEAATFALRLLGDEEFERAIEFLERTLPELPDENLSKLLKTAQDRLNSFKTCERAAISQGEELLRKEDFDAAARFLSTQPQSYSRAPEFRRLVEAVREQQLRAGLEEGLRETPDLDAQVRILEEAVRKGGGVAIEKRLLVVRERWNLVRSVVDRARNLESSNQYDQALREWTSVRSIYPQFPGLEAEIARVTKLAEQRQIRAVRGLPSDTCGSPQTSAGGDWSATKLMGVSGTAAPPPVSRPAAPIEVTKLRTQWPQQTRILAWCKAAAIALFVLGMSIGLWFYVKPKAGTPSGNKNVYGVESQSPPTTPGSTNNTEYQQRETQANPKVSPGPGPQNNSIPSNNQLSKKTRLPQGTSNVISRSNSGAGNPVAPHAGPESAKNSTSGTHARPQPSAGTSDAKQSFPVKQGQTTGDGNAPFTGQIAPPLAPVPGDVTNLPTVVTSLPTTLPKIPDLPKGNPLDREKTGVQAALDRYVDAYGSESLDEIRRAWPTVSKDQQKSLKEAFNRFSAIRLSLSGCDIRVAETEATANCQQTARYTEKGKVQPAQTAAVSIQLKKQVSRGWVIDSVSAR